MAAPQPRKNRSQAGDRPNPNGTYTVTFADGTRQVVSPDLVVDPDAATTSPSGASSPAPPVFARSRPEGALYLPLLEKAYAQEHGGYGAIEGGRSSEVIEQMTGREESWIDDDDVSVDDLARRFDEGESLGLSTIDRPDPPDGTSDEDWPDEWRALRDTPGPFKESFGTGYQRLYPDHAFVVVDVDAAAGTVSVINPWDPSQPPFELTEAELRDSVNGVRVNAAP